MKIFEFFLKKSPIVYMKTLKTKAFSHLRIKRLIFSLFLFFIIKLTISFKFIIKSVNFFITLQEIKGILVF